MGIFLKDGHINMGHKKKYRILAESPFTQSVPSVTPDIAHESGSLFRSCRISYPQKLNVRNHSIGSISGVLTTGGFLEMGYPGLPKSLWLSIRSNDLDEN